MKMIINSKHNNDIIIITIIFINNPSEKIMQ